MSFSDKTILYNSQDYIMNSTVSAWNYLKQSLNLDGKCQVGLGLEKKFCFQLLNSFIYFYYNKEFGGNEVKTVLDFVVNHDLVDFTKELVWQKLYNETRSRIVPNFWSKFTIVQKETSGSESFAEAVSVLNAEIKRQRHYLFFLDQLSKNANQTSFDCYKAHLSAVLLSQIPSNFECIVNSFYTRAFRAFMCLEKRSINFGIMIQTSSIVIHLNNKFVLWQMETNLVMSSPTVQDVIRK